MMAVSFKYWDECVQPEDMEAMWSNPDVSKEWIDAGETKGQKVLLSRDPDGQPYLTQTEMKAVAEIVVDRHFRLQIDPDMICAIAEIESDRQLLSKRYNKKTKETSFGLMNVTLATGERMYSEMGYQKYILEGNSDLLHKPFINVYFGAAYLKWLCGFDGKERDEQFMVRSFKGGTKKATHKSTLIYWDRYLSAKHSLPSRREPLNYDTYSAVPDAGSAMPATSTEGDKLKYWDSRVSREDMEELWRHPDVLKEWTKSGERRGVVRFSHDKEKKPYLSRTEVKAVAGIVISRYFNCKGIEPGVLCALAELSSMRFVNGISSRVGLMGIDFPTASWLYNDVGYKAYQVNSVEDLLNPFASMYFGAAYLVWLSNYEGRERTHEFIVQAYIGGPQNVNIQETGTLWLKFQNAYALYRDPKREGGSCSIL